MSNLIDGKYVSNIIKTELADIIKDFIRKPKLVVIQVGENPASNIYVKNKKTTAEKTGIIFEHLKYEENITENDIIKEIDIKNKDNNIDGIIVQLPLPKHLDEHKILNTIIPGKDVDGLTDINLGKLLTGDPLFTSCTPTGVIELLKYYQIPISGQNIVIVGRSNLVGKPLIHLFLKEDATVTVCHSKTLNLSEITSKADILVVAVGKPKFITNDMVKQGAVVIDVGINRGDNKIEGDVDFQKVDEKTSYITPVPGGVGPMTIAILLKNVVKSYLKKR